MGVFGNFCQGSVGFPIPVRVDGSGEDAVPGFGEAGEFVSMEGVELGAGGFEDEESFEAGAEFD